MKRQLIIYGAGRMARLVAWFFDNDSDYEVAGFVVDDEYKDCDEFLGRPLVAASEVTERFPPTSFRMFVAMSYTRMSQVRAQKCEVAKGLGYQLATYVSSRCTYLSEKRPGPNSFVLEDNTIQPFVTLGEDVWLWSGNHIGHDTVIEDHNYIASQVVVSGYNWIGSNCFIGVNATFAEGLRIAPFTLVGAGATIVKDTEERGVYVPSRSVKLERTSDQFDL